jgi:hypothetical protein
MKSTGEIETNTSVNFLFTSVISGIHALRESEVLLPGRRLPARKMSAFSHLGIISDIHKK